MLPELNERVAYPAAFVLLSLLIASVRNHLKSKQLQKQINRYNRSDGEVFDTIIK